MASSTDTLGARIRHARKSLGDGTVSQEQLARAVGVSALTPSRWERNIATPSIETLRRVAEYTERPLEFFEEALPSPDPNPLEQMVAQLMKQLQGGRETSKRKRQYVMQPGTYVGPCRRGDQS